MRAIGAATSDVILDSKIRDWVLIPILIVMILMTVLRDFVTRLMKTDPKKDEKAIRES
jgi:ER membrane protein complex subunit 3